MYRTLQVCLFSSLSACTLISLDSLQDGIAADGGNGGAGASNPDGGSTNQGAASAGGEGGGGTNTGGSGGSTPTFEDCILGSDPAIYLRMGSPDSLEPNLGNLGGTATYVGARSRVDGLILEDDGASSFGPTDALALDGASAIFGGFQPFTVELWVKVPADFATVDLMLLQAAPDFISVQLRRRQVEDGFDAFWLRYSGGTGERQVTHSMKLLEPADQEHHLALVYRQTADTVFDGSGVSNDMAIYLDGALVESQAAGDPDTPAPTVDATFLLGNGFVGVLDEIAVFTRELSATEVEDHYAYGLGTRHCD